MGGMGHTPSRGRLEFSSPHALSDFNSLGVALIVNLPMELMQLIYN